MVLGGLLIVYSERQLIVVYEGLECTLLSGRISNVYAELSLIKFCPEN